MLRFHVSKSILNLCNSISCKSAWNCQTGRMCMGRGYLTFLTATLLTLAIANGAQKTSNRIAGGHGNLFIGCSIRKTLLKLASGNEEENFKTLANDKLATFVPKYYGVYENEVGERYLEMQDLTKKFTEPSVMDIKMGCRTFMEEEVLKVINDTAEVRADLYRKMLNEDPVALSSREHRLKAVTKARYMRWHDNTSTTASLGFKIVAMVMRDGTKKREEFKFIRDRDEVAHWIRRFVGENPSIRKQYVERLRNLRRVLGKSRFFMSHEFIGSSLLFLHDDSMAGVWLIDLVRIDKLPEGVKVNHLDDWHLGNHEDCYLRGLDHLIHIMSELCQ